ncbi:glycoside hydrolase family 19 protein [Pseudomonas sp. PNPG3]|uniref:glycoside hydrolase family 19 protein n=1 Tax=Pseudomonas sp. PNPG3 TaxID=2919497 RepID=UPI001FFD5E6B|nr:glycoside hydrolase family 19 protein [Pseudomonas sp. PNPG3]MCK2122103.1 hypothetical protein [Pseudomonas sp. PNPG3]
MEKILGQDQYDQSGFLVGPKTEEDMDKEGRQIDILRAIHGDTQETVDQLARIADGIGQLAVTPAPAAPAARVVGGQGGDEPQPSILHAAPAEPGDDGDRGEQGLAAPVTGPDASPVTAVQPEADLSAAPTLNVHLAALSEPGRASVQIPPSAAPTQPHQQSTPPASPSTQTPFPAPAMAAAQATVATAAAARPPLPPTGQPAIADPEVAAAEKTAREGKQRDQERQANGRFGSSPRQDRPADAGGDGRPGRTGEALAAASESLQNAARGMADGADNIDPSVQAAKEVSAVVSPVLGIFKPLVGLFGFKRSTPEEKRHRTDVFWYRRIWGTLRDKKSDSRMGLILTGLLAALGMLLAPIKALARMTGIMRGLAAAGGLMKAAGGLVRRRGANGRRGRDGRHARADGRDRQSRRTPAEARKAANDARHAATSTDKVASHKTVATKPGAPPEARKPGSTVSGADSTKNTKGTDSTKSTTSTKAPESGRVRRPGLGSRLGRLAKGAAKGVPFLGAVLGLGVIASTAMAKDEPGATPEERQQAKAQRFGTYGSVAGGLLGGALGMFGGPAGAIAGGMLGEQLGEAVGTWLSTVDLQGMVDGVSTAFLGLAKSASDQVGKAFDFVRAKWDGLVATATTALTGMADWAKERWTAATERIAAVRDTVSDRYTSAKQAVSDGATSIKDAGQNALHKITGGRYTGGSNARKDELIKAMDAGGITDAKSKAALMANVDHESGGFTRTEENLNYSAKRLQQVFPKYYQNIEQARADAGNPEAIANRVYGGRMGNTESGDGFKYRGRGDIQLTGKAQYEAMGKKLGIDLVNNPELASDPKYSAQIAVQHWKDSGANTAAIRGDITGARKETNGGTNGLSEVKAKYEQYLVQAKAGDLTPTRRADQVRVAAPAAAVGAIASTMTKVTGHTTVVPGVTGNKPAFAGGPVPMDTVPGQAGAGPGATPISPTAAAPTPAKPLGMIPIASMQAAPASPAPATGNAPTGAAVPKLATAAPAPLVLAPPPSYSAPAANASTVKVPSTPSVTKPLLGASSKTPPPPAAPMILSQDLEDRRIAHAATGGLGGQSRM